MDITVSSRHVEVAPALRAAAIDKIGRLERYLEDMDRAEVHFSAEHNPRIEQREICEVTISGPGHVVRAKVTAADQFAAIDAAVAKLEHQLHKLKSKLLRRDQPDMCVTGGQVSKQHIEAAGRRLRLWRIAGVRCGG